MTAGRSAGTEQGQGREVCARTNGLGVCRCGWTAPTDLAPAGRHWMLLKHLAASPSVPPSVPPARDSGRDEAREAVARPWMSSDGDTRCQSCGLPNPVWWADSKQWNATVGGASATEDPGGVLCPTCFHQRWLAALLRDGTGRLYNSRDTA